MLSPWPGHTVTVCGQADLVCQHHRGFLPLSSPGLQSRADAAFSPSQYYEMSYGLNIEMHKQVSLAGLGALSTSLVPAPSPHFAIWAPHR